MTRMLYSGFSAIAALMAAITALSVPAPFWSSTRRLMMLRLRRDAFESLANTLDPVELAPLPAIRPATCVPWPY